MEYIKTLVKGTDSSEVQEILSNLSTYDDLLLLSGEVGVDTALKVSYLSESGKAIKLGEIPEEVIKRIENNSKGDVCVELEDFGVYKRDNGTNKLWVALNVKEEKKQSKISKSSVILGAAVIACGCLALTAAAAKLIELYRED